MSKMSFLDKLLDGVEVEWKRLGNVVRIKNGKDHKTLADGKYPVYGSGGIMRYADTYAYDKPSVLIPRKGSLGNLFFVDVPFWNVDTIFYTEIDEEQIIPKFLYYYLSTVGLGEMNQAGGVPSQTQAVLNELKIPTPCPENPKKSLEIQSEIVRILDAFTAMTAELTAGLSTRQKQYNYYRDKLLSFEEGEVEWKPLVEIGRIVTGRTPKSSDKSAWGDEVDFVTPSDIKCGMRTIMSPSRRLSAAGAAAMSKVQIPSGSLLVTCIGADMGKTVINANDCVPNQQINAIVLTCGSVQTGYLFHVLTAMRDILRRQGEQGGGTMPLINKSDFSKIVVPIPALTEQARIVAILDKFDALTNSSTEGLPREIELRQKQYEYYRDLLLNFPKPGEAAA
ncbi:MAG: restriction endonuclease subunit S [Anaerolineaceae bacterium]|nr:restriction endonuclease subunit S [Anaerolineaceae bacterium]